MLVADRGKVNQIQCHSDPVLRWPPTCCCRYYIKQLCLSLWILHTDGRFKYWISYWLLQNVKALDCIFLSDWVSRSVYLDHHLLKCSNLVCCWTHDSSEETCEAEWRYAIPDQSSSTPTGLIGGGID
jgi:hypothetical protein